jgi:NADPH2:quinone reductase
MRAIICDRYGPPDILRIEDVERPVPADDEVLVKIQASTVNRSDTHTRAGTPFISRFFHGLRRPNRRIPGSEFAGEIDTVGAAVTEFEVGDRVFGVYPFWSVRAGAHAEFMCIPERAPLVQMPAGVSFEEAAAVPDGAILANLFWTAWTRRIGHRHVVIDIPPHYRKQDLLLLKELIEAGKYRAVIDRRYPLEQVIEVSRYVETEQKTGNVVLTVT